MTETYLIFKHEQADVWLEVGPIDAGYPEAAVKVIAPEQGEGTYLVIGPYGHDRVVVTARAEYDVERLEPEPTLAEAAVEPPF